MKLRDLAFSDVYISVDCEAFLRGVPGELGILAPPEEVAPDLIGLHAILSVSARERSEFSVRYDGIVYRVSSIASQQGRWWVCRRGMMRVPTLAELGIPGNLAELMVSLGQERGLFLITGASSQGKSTSAAALMASWLGHFGDVGVAIENPPEAPLEGPHGESGWCFQIDAAEEQVAEALAQARRWRPKFIYLGEINSPQVALQALRCASNQMAVVATFYASSLREGVDGFMRLATEKDGEVASEMFADALAMCIHQKLSGEQRRLVMDVLLPTRKSDDLVRAYLRRGDTSGLADHVKTAMAKKPAG